MAQVIPSKALDCPQAWLGTEMAASDNWIRPFSSAEIEELEAAARNALGLGKSLRELTRADFQLPSLSATCRDWLAELDSGRGFLLLRGLPVERWGLELSQLAYLGLGLHMGGLASQNAAGDLLGHVRDTGADPQDTSVRLYKTRVELGFHSDGSDLVGLLCIRQGRSGGATRLVSTAALYDEILKRRRQLVVCASQAGEQLAVG